MTRLFTPEGHEKKLPAKVKTFALPVSLSSGSNAFGSDFGNWVVHHLVPSKSNFILMNTEIANKINLADDKTIIELEVEYKKLAQSSDSTNDNAIMKSILEKLNAITYKDNDENGIDKSMSFNEWKKNHAKDLKKLTGRFSEDRVESYLNIEYLKLFKRFLQLYYLDPLQGPKYEITYLLSGERENRKKMFSFKEAILFIADKKKNQSKGESEDVRFFRTILYLLFEAPVSFHLWSRKFDGVAYPQLILRNPFLSWLKADAVAVYQAKTFEYLYHLDEKIRNDVNTLQFRTGKQLSHLAIPQKMHTSVDRNEQSYQSKIQQVKKQLTLVQNEIGIAKATVSSILNDIVKLGDAINTIENGGMLMQLHGIAKTLQKMTYLNSSEMKDEEDSKFMVKAQLRKGTLNLAPALKMRLESIVLQLDLLPSVLDERFNQAISEDESSVQKYSNFLYKYTGQLITLNAAMTSININLPFNDSVGNQPKSLLLSKPVMSVINSSASNLSSDEHKMDLNSDTSANNSNDISMSSSQEGSAVSSKNNSRVGSSNNSSYNSPETSLTSSQESSPFGGSQTHSDQEEAGDETNNQSAPMFH